MAPEQKVVLLWGPGCSSEAQAPAAGAQLPGLGAKLRPRMLLRQPRSLQEFASLEWPVAHFAALEGLRAATEAGRRRKGEQIYLPLSAFSLASPLKPSQRSLQWPQLTANSLQGPGGSFK